MKKYLIKISICFLFVSIVSALMFSKSNVKASSYVYDYWLNVIPSTEGITYKETYYNTGIPFVSDPNVTIDKFDTLTDMDVNNGRIYLIDQNEKTKINIPLVNGKVATEVANVSSLIVINQNFQYEKLLKSFVLSDYAANKLKEFYRFTTLPEAITPEQITSGEFVDVYTADDEKQVISDNRIAFFLTFEFNNASLNQRGTTFKITSSDGIIPSDQYSCEKVTRLSFLDTSANLNSSSTPESFVLSVDAVKSYLQSKSIPFYDVSEEEITRKENDENNVVYEARYKQYHIILESVKAESAAKDLEKVKASMERPEGVEEPKMNVTSSIITKATFANDSYNGVEVEAVFNHIITPGRAPFAPEILEDGTYSGKIVAYLNSAKGICTTDNYIYIADTGNARILKLDINTFEVLDVYLTPSDPTFYQMYNSSFETKFGVAYETLNSANSTYYTVNTVEQLFEPLKIAVKSSGVVYCIANNVYEGLVEFSSTTEFNRFIGKNEVQANPFKKVWSKILTEAQLSTLALDLPPMFSNVTIGPNGFLYATSYPDTNEDTKSKMVKIINTKGNDIMKRTGYVTPDGDAVVVASSTVQNAVLGSSVFTDVAVSKIGNFTVVDQKRGRLFTYDSEGNLLYITGEQPGGLSSQSSGSGLSNSIIQPVAVNYFYRTTAEGTLEETVVVLDQASRSLILYETTEFGKAVNKATELYQNGVITDTYQLDSNGQPMLDEDGNKIISSMGAESYWREVIKMNSNYELANLGIGKALNRRGEFKEAMKYFKLAHSAPYYSQAFSSYRDEVLNNNFNLLMAAIIAVVLLYATVKICKVIEKKNLKKGRGE